VKVIRAKALFCKKFFKDGKIKKKQPINKQEIIEAFTEMAKAKGIDKDLLQGIIEDTFSLLIKRNMEIKQISILSSIWKGRYRNIFNKNGC